MIFKPVVNSNVSQQSSVGDSCLLELQNIGATRLFSNTVLCGRATGEK